MHRSMVMTKQAHTIEIFSFGYPPCRHITDEIEIGKCKGFNQIIYDVNDMADDIKKKMRDYGVTLVPTTIIDCNIKVVEIPDFPWICSDELYLKLKSEHPLRKN
jgi:hypothetical protein